MAVLLVELLLFGAPFEGSGGASSLSNNLEQRVTV